MAHPPLLLSAIIMPMTSSDDLSHEIVASIERLVAAKVAYDSQGFVFGTSAAGNELVAARQALAQALQGWKC